MKDIDTLEQRWSLLRTIGEPPPLTPGIFLANRDAACAKLKEVFSGNTMQLQLDTYYPDQVVDFVSAYVAAMDEERRVDAIGRCLVIAGPDAWDFAVQLQKAHILLVDPHLDLAGSIGTKLLEKAKRGRHQVVLGGIPGGMPHPNRESLPRPKDYQIREALEKAGYREERARVLAQKTNGDLGLLLRCLQQISLMPEWADHSSAADLAIAVLLGSWNDASANDRAVVEELSGKPFGEWIETIREIALRPATPLTQRDGVWRFVARYEGWYALGPRLGDEHLDRLWAVAVRVMQEKDPQFDLAADQRYAASVYGKVLGHSRAIRSGLADCLALLGSHANALSGCSMGRGKLIASTVVRECLASRDWMKWASLSEVFPLLAEAAPEEFLGAIEAAVDTQPSLFDDLYAQEVDGVLGRQYLHGLLWGLETLAWDPDLFGRAMLCLGKLASIDPGGHSSNRPSTTLTTILLPWLPQTCASLSQRRAVVEGLLRQNEEVGWRLVLSLLPRAHSASGGTRRPRWRNTIPEDRPSRVTQGEYRQQIEAYAELATGTARQDVKRLGELIKRLDDLPQPARDEVVAHLGSEIVTSMAEPARTGLWMALSALVARHRKYAQARWAMNETEVDRIASVAERLTPKSAALRHKRLFAEWDTDLYEGKGSFAEQEKVLDERRVAAVLEVLTIGGMEAVFDLVMTVDSPWRVGYALGIAAANEIDGDIVPRLLLSDIKARAECAGGFVWGRFRGRGWEWVDGLDTSKWSAAQIGQLLAYLPFTPETWTRSTRLLSSDESPYWKRTPANPFHTQVGLEVAVDRLVEYGRPLAAIRCLGQMQHHNLRFESDRAVRTLLAAAAGGEAANATDVYDMRGIIGALQSDGEANREDLRRVEWAYLGILEDEQVYPRTLERQMAEEPGVFCELIRLVFHSKKDKERTGEPTQKAKNRARHAYRLLDAWRTPPGAKDDGTYAGEALSVWLEAVRRECQETGHLEVAMIMVGQVLIHVPADPSGLWIDRGAARILDAEDASEIRQGFCTALSNTRGVHEFTAGQEERELANGYRTQAGELEIAGYVRFAGAMRDLAASYMRQAEHDAARDPFDDLA